MLIFSVIRFCCFENQYRSFVTYGYLIAIKGAKQVFGFGSGKVGRHEQPFAVEYIMCEAVGTRTLPRDVKTSAEKPARLQYAESFDKRFRFVGEDMEAVHRQDTVEALVGVRQLAHIALFEIEVAELHL